LPGFKQQSFFAPPAKGMLPIKRYSQLPLPPYRFRPGSNRHPRQQTGEHLPAAAFTPLNPTNACLATHETFRYALDLFNYGFYWECHEALEYLWRKTAKGTPLNTLLQAMIMLAASRLKWLGNSRESSARFARKAGDKLASLPEEFPGIDIAALRDMAESLLLRRPQQKPYLIRIRAGKDPL
jgi:predicted metal-dependent hydrolase